MQYVCDMCAIFNLNIIHYRETAYMFHYLHIYNMVNCTTYNTVKTGIFILIYLSHLTNAMHIKFESL